MKKVILTALLLSLSGLVQAAHYNIVLPSVSQFDDENSKTLAKIEHLKKHDTATIIIDGKGGSLEMVSSYKIAIENSPAKIKVIVKKAMSAHSFLAMELKNVTFTKDSVIMMHRAVAVNLLAKNPADPDSGAEIAPWDNYIEKNVQRQLDYGVLSQAEACRIASGHMVFVLGKDIPERKKLYHNEKATWKTCNYENPISWKEELKEGKQNYNVLAEQLGLDKVK